MSVKFQSRESFVPRMFLQVYWFWPRIAYLPSSKIVLCFAFVTKTVLETCQCLGYCSAMLAQDQGCLAFPFCLHSHTSKHAWIWESWDSWPHMIHNIVPTNRVEEMGGCIQSCLSETHGLLAGFSCPSIFFFNPYLLHFIILTFLFLYILNHLSVDVLVIFLFLLFSPLSH